MRHGAKKLGAATFLFGNLLIQGCFPTLEAPRGSLNVGLLGVAENVDTVRITITAGTERHLIEEALSPAAVVRTEVVPVGPVAVLAETLAGGTLIQSKGANHEIIEGENEVAIDLGSAGPEPPTEVRSAEQRVTIELRDGANVGGTASGRERSERDPFLAFLASARTALGAQPLVTEVFSGRVVVAGGDFDDLDELWNGAVTVSLEPEGGGNAIDVGTFVPIGDEATLMPTGADVSVLMPSFENGRFDVVVAGPASETQFETDVDVRLVFVATTMQ